MNRDTADYKVEMILEKNLQQLKISHSYCPDHTMSFKMLELNIEQYLNHCKN